MGSASGLGASPNQCLRESAFANDRAERGRAAVGAWAGRGHLTGQAAVVIEGRGGGRRACCSATKNALGSWY
jgi:hypothetical protein